MFIPITDGERRGIELLAKGRHLPKEKAGVPCHLYGRESGLEVHIEGLLGEYAVAKAFNVLPDISLHLHGDDKVDLRLPDGRTAQVKYRRKRGYDYAINSMEEFVADVGILCWPAEGGVEVVGMITRERFKEVAVVENFGYGKRYVARYQEFEPLENAA